MAASHNSCHFQLRDAGAGFDARMGAAPLWRVRNLPLLKVYSQDHVYFVVNARQERDALILNNDYVTLFKLHKRIYGFTSEEVSLALRVCRPASH